MAWRLAKSLERLRAQVNAAVPGRSKASDGSIGDAAHASRASDHNPYIKDKNGVGVVRAIDITHDPKGGFDSYKFADHLRVTGDKRIRYIISNYRIANPGQPWRKYTGANPHDHHVHISVSENAALYDDAKNWDIGLGKASITDRVIASVAEILAPAKPAVLKVGSKGAAVKELQTLLGITADGDFGAFTEKAVRAFQSANGLVVDGIAGSYTLAKLKEKAKPSDPFDKVMEWVFEDEGGVTLSPDEPGGISVFGVSRTAYSEYLKRAVSVDEMKALTKDAARKFYKEKFWNNVATDKPAGLRYATFDFAINSGPATADKYADEHPTIDALCDARLAYLAKLPTAKKYLRGWTNRVERVRQRAKTL
jgi:lysozyme family protein